MMKKLLTCVALLLTFFTVGLALAAKGKQKITKKEETLLGTVSCTVATVKAPTPTLGGKDATPAPGPNGVLPAPGTINTPQPINTVRDCLANGGKVVIQPDGGRGALPIDNPDVVKGHEWHRLSISGYLNGDSFHIVSLRTI